MSGFIIQDTTLISIANAIRGKTGSTNAMSPLQMATAIEGIAGGGSTEEWFDDGNTHLWISLAEGRTAPMLGVCPNGTVTVDWGDGTEPDVLTGKSATSVKWTPIHEYDKPGDYVITLTVDGEVHFAGKGSKSAILCFSSTGDNRDRVYKNALRKIELGNGAILGMRAFDECQAFSSIKLAEGITQIPAYAFSVCYALTHIDLPNGITEIGNSAFYGCGSLASVNIPNTTTIIGASAFSACSSLVSVIIPSGITNVYSSTFEYCYGARLYDFSSHTAVPILSTANAFTGIPADCEIRVPAALAEEWKAATNWSTYASQIVGV